MEELWMGKDIEAGSDDEALGPVVECVKGAITCCKSMIGGCNMISTVWQRMWERARKERLKGGTSDDLSQYARKHTQY
jgi:hypothetical protein